jgi:tripeptidyl-peptidase-1
MDVSHPDSPNFGKHWTAKQVAETFAPSDEAVRSVILWLEESGISGSRVKQSQSLNWLNVEVKVSEAEELLKTVYYKYTHFNGQSHVACEEYSLPADIQRHVDFVTPTLHFDAKIEKKRKRRSMETREIDLAKRQSSAIGHNVAPGTGHSIGAPGIKTGPKSGGKIGAILNELANCDEMIVPNCLRALYEFPANFPANAKSKSDHL